MQGQLSESKAKEEALVQSQSKRPFVLVLIDADAEGFLVRIAVYLHGMYLS
jgi:hypothetical protein